jgi:hypothetical protein
VYDLINGGIINKLLKFDQLSIGLCFLLAFFFVINLLFFHCMQSVGKMEQKE